MKSGNALQVLLPHFLIYIMADVNAVEIYKFRCPVAGHWIIRAQAFCNDYSKYFCLYSNLNDAYVEGCTGPDWDKPGYKRVFQGNFDSKSCAEDVFQPIKFWTNESSDCNYQKSLCAGEGQVACSSGKGDVDRKCRCDHTRGFTFVTPPRNKCYCLETEEDCSCYMKKCGNTNDVLNADYQCSELPHSVTKCDVFVNTTCSVPIMDSPNTDVTPIYTVNTTNLGQMKKYNLEAMYAVSVLLPLIIIITAIAFCKKAGLCKRSCACSHLGLQTKGKRPAEPRTITKDMTDPNQKENLNNVDGANASSAKEPIDLQLLDEIDSSVLTEQQNVDAEYKDISKEQRNYLRVMHLLFRVACPLLRITFDHEIHPDKLHSTLQVERRKLNEIRDEHIVESSQWSHLKPGRFGSKRYDIEAMMVLLKKLCQWQHLDKSIYDGSLSDLKAYYDKMMRKVSGELSDEKFEKYWDKIGRALIRIAGVNFDSLMMFTDTDFAALKKALSQDRTRIQKRMQKDTSKVHLWREMAHEVILFIRERRILRDAILGLNPVKFTNLRFYDIIKYNDAHSLKYLSYVIESYCETQKVSVKNLLNEEKHNMFHKRTNTDSCCKNHCRMKPFLKIINEELWTKMYIKIDGVKDHKSHLSNKCSERFAVKGNVELDRGLACCLILYIHKLSTHCFKMFFHCGGLDNFLNIKKHQIICHHNQVIRNEALDLEPNEVETLYEKYAFRNSTDSVKSPNCDQCFLYTAQKYMQLKNINENLLSKILNLAGPIATINSMEKTLFQTFIHDTLDSDLLDSLWNNLQDAYDSLSKGNSNCKRSSLLETHQDEDDMKVQFILNWIRSQKQEVDDRKLTKVMVDHKIDKEPGMLYSWQRWDNLRLAGSRKPIHVTRGDNNFLKIVHVFNSVVTPTVREMFEEKFSIMHIPCDPQKGKKRVIDIIQYAIKMATRKQKEKGAFSLTGNDTDILTKCLTDESAYRDLTLKLMISLLKLSMSKFMEDTSNPLSERKWSTGNSACFETATCASTIANTVKNLETLDKYRRDIFYSRSGSLTEKKFRDYMENIKKTLEELRGTKFEMQFSRLKSVMTMV